MRKVQADIRCRRGPFRVTFIDRHDKEIDSYNPRNDPRDGKVYEIGENEELIGVYGKKEQDTLLNALGFIVKVRHE